MEILLAIILVVSFIIWPKAWFKLLGLFALGFIIGLKGINPMKWFN